MKVLFNVILLHLFVGYIHCQSNNDLVDDAAKKLNINSDDLDALKKNFGDEIPDISELDSFNKTKLPNAEDVENALKKKCAKNGAEDAVELLKEQQDTVKTCIESYVNFTVIQNELEVAKKTGSMDEVFGKYCKKYPAMYACFDNVTSTARSCMDDSEIKAFNRTLDIVNQLQEFMCFKDGDRLAMFVAEGGVECIQEHKEGVQDCLNATLGGRVPDSNDISAGILPSFLFTPKDCNDFETIRKCVNVELEKCQDTTPANIVDSVLKFLEKKMSCTPGGDKPTEGSPDGSWALTASALIVAGSFISLKIF